MQSGGMLPPPAGKSGGHLELPLFLADQERSINPTTPAYRPLEEGRKKEYALSVD